MRTTIVLAALLSAEIAAAQTSVQDLAKPPAAALHGDPSKRIGDLRHTRIVMMDGKLMDANALRAAGGFAGKPAFVD